MAVSYITYRQSPVLNSDRASFVLPTVQDGDLLVSTIMHRSEITPPSGWNYFSHSACEYGGSITQTVTIFTKTALASEGGDSVEWVAASSGRIMAHVAVYRGDGVCEISNSTTYSKNDVSAGYDSCQIPVLSTEYLGQIIQVSSTSVLAVGLPYPTYFTYPLGYEIISADYETDLRLSVAKVDGGYPFTTSGDVVNHIDPAANSWASISLLISDGSPPPPERKRRRSVLIVN